MKCFPFDPPSIKRASARNAKIIRQIKAEKIRRPVPDPTKASKGKG
jgi:hypothetical protein